MVYLRTVREDAGGTYGVSCNGSLSKYPTEKGAFQVYFDTDPNRREEMVKLINEGIQEFIEKGPVSEDLSKVKEYMLKTYKQNQKENGYDLKAFAKTFFGQKNEVEVSMSSPVQK